MLMCIDMAAKEKEESQALGPSIVLGLVGAIVVLVVLGAGIWGASKVITKIRQLNEESKEEKIEESKTEDEVGKEESVETSDEKKEEGGEDENASQEQDKEGTGEEEKSEEEKAEDKKEGNAESKGPWVVNNYVYGDIKGDKYTVVRGDTLWEIAEAKYGSGFEWHKILNANFNSIGYLPNGSHALIVPGQVLVLP